MKIKNIGAGVLAAGMLVAGSTSAFAAESKGNMIEKAAETIMASISATVSSVDATKIELPEGAVAFSKIELPEGKIDATKISTPVSSVDATKVNLAEGVVAFSKIELPEGTEKMEKIAVAGTDAAVLTDVLEGSVATSIVHESATGIAATEVVAATATTVK